MADLDSSVRTARRETFTTDALRSRTALPPDRGNNPSISLLFVRALADILYRLEQHVWQQSKPHCAPSSKYDVFLSYQTSDRGAVRLIYEELVRVGVRPWFDEEHLKPGISWQNALESIIRTARSAAVFVGPHGLEPWLLPEVRACLCEFVHRGMPVIPVLLPGAPSQSTLPVFLRAHHPVDLRTGVSDLGLERLVWGITGEK